MVNFGAGTQKTFIDYRKICFFFFFWKDSNFMSNSGFFPSKFILVQKSPRAWGYTRRTWALRHLRQRLPHTPTSRPTCCLVLKTWVRNARACDLPAIIRSPFRLPIILDPHVCKQHQSTWENVYLQPRKQRNWSIKGKLYLPAFQTRANNLDGKDVQEHLFKNNCLCRAIVVHTGSQPSSYGMPCFCERHSSSS